MYYSSNVRVDLQHEDVYVRFRWGKWEMCAEFWWLECTHLEDQHWDGRLISKL